MSPDVSAKLTSLSFFPGLSENSTEGGDELNNSLPDNLGPIDGVDEWFHGDFTTQQPDSLSIANSLKKELEEFPGERFNQYRFKNQIDAEFTTADGQSIDRNSVNIITNIDDIFVTLENENNLLRESSVNSTLFNGAKKLKASTRPRHLNWEINTVNGIDAVQASTIWGSFDPYVERMLTYIGDAGIQSFFSALGTPAVGALAALVTATPTIYTWIELTVLADGTKLARVWDASRYPKHVGYLDNDKMESTSFERGTDWELNENSNATFNAWVAEEQTHVVVPYGSPHFAYLTQFDDVPFVGGTDPVMVFGKDKNGSTLTDEQVNNTLPNQYLSPF